MTHYFRRPGGRAVGVLAVGLLTALPAYRLSAQDSQFGVRGLGTPGRAETVRARSTAGAFAPFDPLSSLVDAALVSLGRFTASVTGGTSWRSADIAGADASLRATRFPVMTVGGPIRGRWVLGGGFSTYLDRSYTVVTTDTIDIRGSPEVVTDEIASDGGVSDLRLALARRLGRHLALGASVRGLSGSAQVTATRRFADSTLYHTSSATDDVNLDGLGGAASVLVDLGSVRVAAWGRSDTRLVAQVRGVETARNDLPIALGGAVRWQPGAEAAFAAAATWRSWSDAGVNAYDTFNWSVGAELGDPRLPLRLGVRGGTLPFGPGTSAPTEFGAALGLGRSFSNGRGRIDAGLERLERRGAGLTERVWTFLFGLTVQP